MIGTVKNYYHWLHGQWPAAKTEPLPLIDDNGMSSVKGVYVVGDLTGLPLLKFAADSGAKAVRQIISRNKSDIHSSPENVYPLVIIGGGVSGYSAALEAKKEGVDFLLIEAQQPLSTLENFPKEKPIFTYPTAMTPAGAFALPETLSVKETLLGDLKQKIDASNIEASIRRATHIRPENNHITIHFDDDTSVVAMNVIVAIGRAGKYRSLDVSGEEKDKVVNRLHDPKVYSGKKLLVVGGGDSALEAAIACSKASADVTICYRKPEFSRPKADNVEALNALIASKDITLKMGCSVKKIEDEHVVITHSNGDVEVLPNDEVLTMIGREAPLEFFKRSGITVNGESSVKGWAFFALFIVAMVMLYDWKNFGFLNNIWSLSSFPNDMPLFLSGIGEWWQTQIADRSTLLGTIAVSMKSRSFYYTILYTLCIGIFGWRRIKSRKTPYVAVQTWTLFLVQLIPLFILPEILLPYLGYNGAFDAGWMRSAADSLFPSYISVQELASHSWPEWGHPRAYWHAYGFILAWPLNVYNVFTPTPIVGWLIIGFIQTFILIPLLVYKYGKGAYCGWICSCGALAETMGDTQRHKMPRGAFFNKLNMVGQFLLLVAFVMLAIRIGGWLFPDTWMNHMFNLLLKGENSEYQLTNPISWKWMVDVLLGGIIGVGFYFKYSGRVWCRFACPLAALMHIYARFSRFRIFADKKKCISCNACTTTCHQGIDVMSFANKGEPMQDPQCVRCSACVQVCPTGVLSFGEIDRKTNIQISSGMLIASTAQQTESVKIFDASEHHA